MFGKVDTMETYQISADTNRFVVVGVVLDQLRLRIGGDDVLVDQFLHGAGPHPPHGAAPATPPPPAGRIILAGKNVGFLAAASSGWRRRRGWIGRGD